MKSRYILFASIAVVSLACCTKNEPAVPGVNNETDVQKVVGQTSLTAIINAEDETSKAVVDDNGTVTWSAGDALSVYTGSGFTTFTLDGAGGSGTGTFKADGTVTPQIVAVYPAGTHSLAGNNLTVNLPASYTLKSVDDTNTNVPMIATGDFATGKLSFKQIGGLFRFTHYTVPPAARKFRFAANGHKINGDFVIDITASEPTLVAGTSSSAADSVVTVSFPAPTDTVEMSFFIPIPTESYNNLTISLLDDSDNVLWTHTTGSPAGTSTIDIVRKTFMKMPAVGGIKTAEELMTLASRFNAGKSIAMYKDCSGEITLRDDIDLTGKTWTPIGNVETTREFGEVFNGRFKTIDNLVVNGTFASQYAQSLFGVLAATAVIKNLTLGENSSITYARTSGMVRCAAIVDFARYAGAKLINLTNKADITVTHNGTDGRCWVGGIAGNCRADVINCRNEGDITINNSVASTTTSYGPVVGGVIGICDGGTSTIKNCDNSGIITINTVNVAYGGGVIGRLSAARVLDDLVNSGSLSVSGANTSSYFGGVVGHMVGTTATNLHNTASGAVKNMGSVKVNIGGVIGYITSASNLSGIINNGLVYAVSNTKMGGLIGTFGTSINLSGSAFGGDLQCYSGQGADVGLVIGTDGYLADANTLSNIKISGKFGPSGSQCTIASAENYDDHVQTDYSKTWANDKSKMRLVNPTPSAASDKEALYAKFLAACSYGTMSTE